MALIILKMNYVTAKTFKMKFTFALMVLAASSCYAESGSDEYWSKFIADLWLEASDVVRVIWRDCSKKLLTVKETSGDQKEYFRTFVKCIKRKTLRALDRSLSPDVVPIAEGVNLIRFDLADQPGNALQENYTSTWSEENLDTEEWKNLVLQRMVNVLRTHVIKVDFDNNILNQVEYRGRRRHHMMTMMMFGIVSIGMVFIPMGFQFLAVLGGKALLLAKMALILASIQGLRKVEAFDGYLEKGKIAASPINYGFYHSFPPYEHFDRRGHNNIIDPIQALASNRNFLLKNNKLGVSDTGLLKINGLETEDNKKMPKGSVLYDITPELDIALKNYQYKRQLLDFTSTPGEVQADYALELPYNGFRFQSSTPVISA